jgi:hypothetical protein
MRTEEQTKQYVTALLAERAMADRKGDTDTVGQVDAELRRVGHKAEKPAKRAERRPRQQVETRTAVPSPVITTDRESLTEDAPSNQ